MVILMLIDYDCVLEKRKGYRVVKNLEESVKWIIGDLLEKNVFKFIFGRVGYWFFFDFDVNLLKGFDYRDLYKWMIEYIFLWGLIYEGCGI